MFVVLLGFSAPALAAPGNFVYLDRLGTDVDYLDINETTNTGTELFMQPQLVGDDLVFFPQDYTSLATGVGGFDLVTSLLNVTIMAKNGTTLDAFRFTEDGDSLLLDPLNPGTGGPFNFIQLAGTLTVLESVGGVSDGTSIPFSVGAGNVTFNPSDALDLGNAAGSTSWTGVVYVDLMGLDATKVELQLDNNLLSQTFEAGETARLQKKDGGIRLEIVPEPSTSLLIGLGLAALGVRRRRI